MKENIEHHIEEEEGEMFRQARRVFDAPSSTTSARGWKRASSPRAASWGPGRHALAVTDIDRWRWRRPGPAPPFATAQDGAGTDDVAGRAVPDGAGPDGAAGPGDPDDGGSVGP